MPSPLHRVQDPTEVVKAIKLGKAALYPWEWLPPDLGPLDWAHKIVTYGTLLAVDIGVNHVARFRLSFAVNPAMAPTKEHMALAMAELEHYRDVGHELMPTEQALLLAQRVPRLAL
ncbi:hypothetical protein AB0878_44770 [Amycolatopsis sp. NPDC047767]|uniref:hypothetical protein n=1 Tax=Amycolatopsis sp. NPDC047767 TaxID=3156765 RepID=UPI0034555F92